MLITLFRQSSMQPRDHCVTDRSPFSHYGRKTKHDTNVYSHKEAHDYPWSIGGLNFRCDQTFGSVPRDESLNSLLQPRGRAKTVYKAQIRLSEVNGSDACTVCGSNEQVLPLEHR
ncbi:hypothetical protein NW754_009670 [Fusarium falciforme]|nr:hypothetical protein NW754_009670 [Fusarium falciforme]